MRRLGFLLLAALLLNSSSASSLETVVTPAKGASCKQDNVPEPYAREESGWQCDGPAGHKLIYFDHVMGAGISIGFKGQKIGHETLNWAPAKSGIGSRVEWHLDNGKPVFAIVSRWRRAQSFKTSEEVEVQEFLVIRTMLSSTCAMGAFLVSLPNALDNARGFAERMWRNWRCTNKSFENPISETDGVKALDAGFAAVEMLDHNGSIVELKRDRSGTIEIKYVEPRPTLKIAPGAVLFRGNEHRGQVSGEAFVFKPGCPPAGYDVSGKRQDGTLILQGALPRRANGCTVITNVKGGKIDHLLFEHEPLVASPLKIAMKRLQTIAQCGKCMSATVLEIDGVGSERARIKAEILDTNIRDYCENWNIDVGKVAACVAEYAKDKGSLQTASANCMARTVEPSSGGAYRFAKMVKELNYSKPSWIDAQTGKPECDAQSCNSDTASYQFGLLCPGAIPEWPVSN